MNSKMWMRKALSMCLVVAIYATYSMVILAASDKTVGELSVAGQNQTVMINGEAAQNGRSIFTSSTIVTPEETSAVVSIAKVGKVEIAPNTTLTLSFDENSINGNLTDGKITVLDANNNVSFTTPDGKTVKLKAGESVTAGKAQDDDDDDTSGSNWFVWALIFGGAAAAVVIAATTDNNRTALGGGSTVVSPIR